MSIKNPSPNGSQPSSPKKNDWKSEKNQTEDFRENKTTEELFASIQDNSKEQVVTYVLLALGIVFIFINSLLGTLIVGGVAGYYFTSEVVYTLRHLISYFEGEQQLRNIVFAVVLLALFLMAPGIFVGAAIVAAFKYLLYGK